MRSDAPLGNVDLSQMRVVVQRVSKPPNNPIRPRPPASSTVADDELLLQSSNGDSSVADRKEQANARNLLRTLLQLSARDFVTGASSCDLEPAHLLDPLRRLERLQTRRGFRLMTAAAEQWLTGLGFNRGETFEFDGTYNLLLLCPNYHALLDTYGVIAFTPPFTLLRSLLSQLIQDNAEWEKRHKADPAAKRNLDHPVYDSADIEWHTLVLHPDEFSRDEQPFFFLKPGFRTLAPVPAGLDAWVPCRVLPHPHFGTHMLYTGDTPLAPRSPYPLSLFAVIANLQSKVAAAVSEAAASPTAADTSLTLLHLLLERLVAEIFFSPADWAPALALQAAFDASLHTGDPAAAPPGETPRQTATPPPDASASALPDVSASQPAVGRVDSATVAAWANSVPSSSGIVDHSDDHQRGEDGVEDEDSDRDADSEEEEVVRGVTESEYVTLLQRIADPPAGGQSRRDDLRMLFFGAGYEQPMSLASPRREEAARDAAQREADS